MRWAPTALALALSIGCSLALPSNAAFKAAKAKAALVQPGARKAGKKAPPVRLAEDKHRNIWQDKYMASIKNGGVDEMKEKAAAIRRAIRSQPTTAKTTTAPVDPVRKIKTIYDGPGFDDAPWKTIADIQGDQLGARAGQCVAMSDKGDVVAFRMPGYTATEEDGIAVQGSNPGSNPKTLLDCPSNTNPETRCWKNKTTGGWIKAGVNLGATRIYAKNDLGDWVQRGNQILGTGMHNHWEDQNIALSGDGTVIAYGLPHGHFDGVDRAGSLRVFQYNAKDDRWQRKGSDKHEGAALESQLPGEGPDMYVGWSIALDYTGDTIAFGAPGIWAWHKEIPNTVNYPNDEDDLTYEQVLKIRATTDFEGAVRVFQWTDSGTGSVVGGNWHEKGTQLAGLDIADLNDDANGDVYSHAGKSVALSSDGNVLAFGVSTIDEDGNEGTTVSAVRVFEWIIPVGEEECASSRTAEETEHQDNHCWVPKGTLIVGADSVGNSMSLSKDGNVIAFGGMGMVKVFTFVRNLIVDSRRSDDDTSTKLARGSKMKHHASPRWDGTKHNMGKSSVPIASFVANGIWVQRGQDLGEYATVHVNQSIYGSAYKHYAISMSYDGSTLAYAVPYEVTPLPDEGEGSAMSMTAKKFDEVNLVAVKVFTWNEDANTPVWESKGVPAWSKRLPWQCPSSPPVPPQGAPGGSGQVGTPRVRHSHWAPSHCLGCSSEPPPKSPIHCL